MPNVKSWPANTRVGPYFATGHTAKRHLGDHIGHIALRLDRLALGDHRWVVVYALAGKYLPEIKAGGIGAEVSFPDHGFLVTDALEEFGKCRMGAVESRPGGVVVEPVRMGVFPGEHGGMAGTADGIWNEATTKRRPVRAMRSIFGVSRNLRPSS